MLNWHGHVVTWGCVVVLVALFGNLPCAGQTASTGALLGEVLDPSGRAIPGGSVQATNTSLSFNRSVLTDDQGHFAFSLLPPGTYKLSVTKTGYIQVQSAIVQV